MAIAVDHRIGRDEIIWAFGPDLGPGLEVEPGGTVPFETNDCYPGQISWEDALVTEIDFGRVNSATGPVAVKGAEPGDSLVAEIVDVRPIDVGFACLIPGFGQLIDRVQAPVTRLFRVEDGWIEMNERVRFPARPMVGVVGVATDGETLTNGLAGRHGGNLDNHLHGKGARIFFPVRQEGGLFAVGDMDASMGDGEICFTGVEIAGEVDILFELLRGKQATWPVTELEDCAVGRARGGEYEDARQLCWGEAARRSSGGSRQHCSSTTSPKGHAGCLSSSTPAPASARARSPNGYGRWRTRGSWGGTATRSRRRAWSTTSPTRVSRSCRSSPRCGSSVTRI